ncbi:MAG: SOS response-associated peptidase [Candidatus Marinimicrobia bacterium]|nr:SOS response-associated peptidase [Candidatus Neomarinimicrobiota bacterium]
MCGRKTLTRDMQSIIEELAIGEWEDSDNYTPSYNIAPAQFSPILIQENDSRIVRPMKWGLIPSWSKDETMGAKLINARSETLLEKPSFQNLVPRNRCVVISDGYYEWQRRGSATKQPVYIHHPRGRLLPMAGLWSAWTSSAGDELLTYTVITTVPKKSIAHVHTRMPVILHSGDLDTWLGSDQNPLHAASNLLVPYRGDLGFHPVSTMVNSPRNNSPDCIRPITDSSTLDMF